MAINNQEQIKASVAPKAPEVKEDSRDLNNALSETAAGITPGLEAIDFAEQIEGVTEGNDKVSEKIAEKPSEKKGFAFGGRKKIATKGKTIAQIKSELLKNLPTEEAMRSNIKAEIKREMRWLAIQSALISFGVKQGNAFEINNIANKLRELKRLMRSLAHATLEALMSLWLRFVHGVF